MMRRRTLPLLAGAAFLALGAQVHAQDAGKGAAAASAASDAVAPQPDALKGKRAFQRYCAVCHGARGEGGLGPTLQGITTRLTAEQIRHQVRQPRATMPVLYPSPVDSAMLDDLVAFFAYLK